MVLYDILESINYDGIDKSNLGIYLSERPLLVRAFAQGMNIYCKYLSKFSERNIIKRPGEVIKISSDPPEIINAKRAASYITDLHDVNVLVKTLYPDTADDYWTPYSLTVTQVTQIVIPVSDEDMEKVNNYHPIIKQLLSCNDLIAKTNTFIGDMEFVNKTIIPSNFFVRRRSMVLSKISSFISSFIDKAIQKKNRERFNRALEYLNAFHSILVPATHHTELSKLLVEMRHNQLYAEITTGAKRFKKVCTISIPGTGTQNIRDLRDTPHIFHNWIEDNYLVMKKLSPSSSQGIQNITDYLIMYDYLMHNIQGVATAVHLGGAAKNIKSERLPEKNGNDPTYDSNYLELFDLDPEIEKEELGEHYDFFQQIEESIKNINDVIDNEVIEWDSYTFYFKQIIEGTEILKKVPEYHEQVKDFLKELYTFHFNNSPSPLFKDIRTVSEMSQESLIVEQEWLDKLLEKVLEGKIEYSEAEGKYDNDGIPEELENDGYDNDGISDLMQSDPADIGNMPPLNNSPRNAENVHRKTKKFTRKMKKNINIKEISKSIHKLFKKDNKYKHRKNVTHEDLFNNTLKHQKQIKIGPAKLEKYVIAAVDRLIDKNILKRETNGTITAL